MNPPKQFPTTTTGSTLISMHVRGGQSTEGGYALIAALSGKGIEDTKETLASGGSIQLQAVEHLSQAQAWRRSLERIGFAVQVTQRPIRKPGVLATVAFGMLAAGVVLSPSDPLLAVGCAGAGVVLAIKAGEAQRWANPAVTSTTPRPLARIRPLYQTILSLRLPEALLYDVLKDLHHLALRFEHLETLRASGMTRTDSHTDLEIESAMKEAEGVLNAFERSLARFETAGAISDAQGALQSLANRIKLMPDSGPKRD